MKNGRLSLGSDVARALQKRKVRRERRKGGRLLTPGLKCSIGEVLDLSATGIRLVTKSRREPCEIGDRIALVVADEETEIEVEAEAVRVEKLSRRTFEIGARFVDADEQTRGTIARLAVVASNRDSMERRVYRRESA